MGTAADRDSLGAGSGSLTGESSAPDLDDEGTEDLFLVKDFSEAYDNCHAEHLQVCRLD